MGTLRSTLTIGRGLNVDSRFFATAAATATFRLVFVVDFAHFVARFSGRRFPAASCLAALSVSSPLRARSPIDPGSFPASLQMVGFPRWRTGAGEAAQMAHAPLLRLKHGSQMMTPHVEQIQPLTIAVAVVWNGAKQIEARITPTRQQRVSTQTLRTAAMPSSAR